MGHYEVLKECKRHEHNIFLKVPVPGKTRKQVECSLATLPPDLWAGRVLSYLMRGGIPPGDIRTPPPNKGGIIATCGHEIRKVMWEIITKEDDMETGMVVCPECYRRHYRGESRLKKAERIIV
jgi:hypothetical protein